jgi:hypothetical protein
MSEFMMLSPMTCIGFEIIDDCSVAVGLTVPSGCVLAYIQNQIITEPNDAQYEQGIVRWRADGTSPTAVVGITLTEGEDLTLRGGILSQIEFIDTSEPSGTEGNAILYVHYFGGPERTV